MAYFDTVGGQNNIESMAFSLERIAVALEKHNKLLEDIIRISESDGKRVTKAADQDEEKSKALAKFTEMVG